MNAANREFDRLNPTTESKSSNRAEQQSANRRSPQRPRREAQPLPERDNPDAPQSPPRRPRERPLRTYTMDDFPARRKQPRRETEPTPAELDRWDEEWREEWDRGEVDDSAAYEEDSLDVADQTRDVEWLLDALDALDDGGNNDDAFEWEE